jgi:hypothetical protein
MSMLGPSFSRVRGAALSKAGLTVIKDIWLGDRFLNAREASLKFGLRVQEEGAWNAALQMVPRSWVDLLITGPQIDTVAGEWLGVFSNQQDVIPSVVFQPMPGSRCDIGGAPCSWWISVDVPVLQVAAHSRTLHGWSVSDRLSSAEVEPRGSASSKVTGSILRVKAATVLKGPRKKEVQLYFGKIDSLTWDPGRFVWTGAIPFMKYTTKLGREMLKRRKVVPDVVEKKWGGILPARFKLRWKNVWDRSRISKEAGMLWLTWHRSIAVNTWRGRINRNIDQGCLVCAYGAAETVLHRFWECPSTKRAWEWGAQIIHCMLRSPSNPSSRPQINWKQGIFADRAPRRFWSISKLWLLMRTTIMWTLWKERLDATFNGMYWSHGQLFQEVWLGLVDYGRGELNRMKSQPGGRINFTSQWCKNSVLAQMPGDNPLWHVTGPVASFR